MPKQSKRLDLLLGCTALTALGSIAAALMEFLVFLGVGWDSLSFDCLLVITVLSIAGLLTGVAILSDRPKTARIVLILSSAYLPLAFLILTFRGFAPPLGWWLLLPLSVAEISLSFLDLLVFSTLGVQDSAGQ